MAGIKTNQPDEVVKTCFGETENQFNRIQR